ncbi:hypothetical protein T10_4533 [Trichinella papuae]|uniref:Uncharacterized protein n=1 Tax=Trichinella papuae TaxID=268474 RepID=A0A0V1MTE8_9BILA|nr:hypothetical protein T10_4533 [Trichinella papuae]
MKQNDKCNFGCTNIQRLVMAFSILGKTSPTEMQTKMRLVEIAVKKRHIGSSKACQNVFALAGAMPEPVPTYAMLPINYNEYSGRQTKELEHIR